MRVPDAALDRFQNHLTEPVQKNRAMIKQLDACLAKIRADLPEGADAERIEAIGRTVKALVKDANRNTSPFYVRKIHAAARFFLRHDDPATDDGDYELDAQVLEAVAFDARKTHLLDWAVIG